MIPACRQAAHIDRPPHPASRAAGRTVLTALLFAFINLFPLRAPAGGGPEKVLVVVNGDSAISMQVANYYVALRDIPQEHILWLHDIPYPDTIDIGTFRERIWTPIHDFITRNRLQDEIDIIAYSSGFPYAVDFSADVKRSDFPQHKYRGKLASLTGLTYFARHVEAGAPAYLARSANRYFRRNLAPEHHLPRSPTRAEIRLYRKAEQALGKQDYQAAITEYESLIEGFPEHGALWYSLARAYAALGDDARALQALQQAINHGWSNSLQTRDDRYLKTLSDDPAWPRLLELMEAANGPFQAAHGFSSHYKWTGAITPVQTSSGDSLYSYYLSTMLAYTGTYGNSVPEVKRYLAAAQASDGTLPEGAVYLMVNNNVRSTTRQPLFQETLDQLERRGRRAEILRRGRDGQDGILPQGKDDVIGAVVGSAGFSWQSAGSHLLPGAIAESLTSYGGMLNKRGQSKLTEFLRHGAAGSSGAVAEPYAIQEKFPVPLLHVHYADGCSLAEAFYQSVEAPYQLLIVGDPLARPYARFARIRIDSPDPNKAWSGVITLRPEVGPAAGRPIGQIELWVDGQLIAYADPDQPLTWDTRNQDDGFHELRLVAQEAGPVETRSYARFDVMVNNSELRVAADHQQQTARFGEDIILSGMAVGGRDATLWQGNRMLASAPVRGNRWQLQVDSRMLGIGRVTLGVRVAFDDNRVARSAPLQVEITPPASATPLVVRHRPQSTGVNRAASGDSEEAVTVKLNGRLRKLVDVRRLTLQGEIAIDRAGFYELVVVGSGKIDLSVDGRPLLSGRNTGREQTHYFPLTLEQGTHELHIDFSPADRRPYLKLVLEGAQLTGVPEARLVEVTRNGADPT